MARGSFGELLKRERELREVPMEEITLATRIAPRYLEALENEDWNKLPGGVFNRGFVRSIARYLGLDEESLLSEYDLAHNARAQVLEQKNAVKAEDPIPQTPLWIPVTMVLGVILLVAGLVFAGIYGWRRYKRHRSAAASVFVLPAAPSTGVLLELNAPALPPVLLAGVSGTMALRNTDSRQAAGGNSQS